MQPSEEPRPDRLPHARGSRENNLVKGELFEFGERFTVELDPPSIPQEYASSVIAAYMRKRLTPAKQLNCSTKHSLSPIYPSQTT